MAQRLTDRNIPLLPCPERSNQITYDAPSAKGDVVRGFGVRVTAAGARSFILNYRRKGDGTERRLTIGKFPEWTVTAAREEARRLRAEINNGADPVEEEKSSRAAPTVADLCARFSEEYIPRKRPATQRDYRQQIAADILPAMRHLKVATVGYSDVDSLHRKLTKRAPIHANRVMAVLSKMFNLAIRWGWRSTNPVRGIERNDEAKRRRYLSNEELLRLTESLSEHDDQQAANIFRLLLLTGARRGEVLGAKWADIDLENGLWTKPGATTKQRTEHRVPLSGPARQLLAGIERTASPFVFAGRNGQPRKKVRNSWIRLCEAAGITGLRVHDLRHSYASQLASAGTGLHIIGALLGHTQPATTHRYAHLFDDPLRQATERAGAIITGKPSAEVVPLKGGHGG